MEKNRCDVLKLALELHEITCHEPGCPLFVPALPAGAGCITCGSRATVSLVHHEKQQATYFCSLACAQGFDFARGEAQRREWAQMEQGE